MYLDDLTDVDNNSEDLWEHDIDNHNKDTNTGEIFWISSLVIWILLCNIDCFKELLLCWFATSTQNESEQTRKRKRVRQIYEMTVLLFAFGATFFLVLLRNQALQRGCDPMHRSEFWECMHEIKTEPNVSLAHDAAVPIPIELVLDGAEVAKDQRHAPSETRYNPPNLNAPRTKDSLLNRPDKTSPFKPRKTL